MTIRVRPIRRGVWEVDIHTQTPTGRRIRQRVYAPVSTRQAAVAWGRERERVLALGTQITVVPTLREFSQRYFQWLPSRGHKQTGIATRERAIRLHVLPVLGDTRLSEITEEGIGSIAASMPGAAPKTINGAISVLGTMLRVAVRWRVIPALPCPVDLVRAPTQERPFYDFQEYARLVSAAERIGWQHHLIALLGGRAGLRRGEIIALRWVDVSLERDVLTVRRQYQNGRISAPKGGRERTVPLAAELRSALERYRGTRDLVVSWEDGSAICEQSLKRMADSAAKSAGLLPGIHILRHTFVSHLVMRGVPPRTIQELAGHRSLATTMGYMHLSPAAGRDGIAALGAGAGDVAETARARSRNRKGRKP